MRPEGMIEMVLIACTCPHCGGTVNMEETMVSGFCTYCGKQVINDRAVVGNINVRMDRTAEVVNILKLAKYSMYDRDGNGARALVSRAMQMDPNNSDVWYMDAVLDRANAKNDIKRARQYPSLGVFEESEVEVYRNFDDSMSQTVLIVSVMVAFLTVFVSLPIGLVFEAYLLIPAALAIGLALIAAAIIHIRRHRRNIPPPVFGDEERAVAEAARERARDEASRGRK